MLLLRPYKPWLLHVAPSRVVTIPQPSLSAPASSAGRSKNPRQRHMPATVGWFDFLPELLASFLPLLQPAGGVVFFRLLPLERIVLGHGSICASSMSISESPGFFGGVRLLLIGLRHGSPLEWDSARGRDVSCVCRPQGHRSLSYGAYGAQRSYAVKTFGASRKLFRPLATSRRNRLQPFLRSTGN